jgi:hypothetical protein
MELISSIRARGLATWHWLTTREQRVGLALSVSVPVLSLSRGRIGFRVHAALWRRHGRGSGNDFLCIREQ